MNNTKPNLFKYATSELSQDAFLCWFLEWSDPKHESDNPLHKAALDFMFGLSDGKILSVEKLEIFRQYKNIDILVLVNDKFVLPIEDKVHSSEHSDQLTRYKNTIETNFLDKEIIPIYLKTGDQSDFNAAKDAGYRVFKRRDLLKVLDHAKDLGVTSDILLDFRDQLHAIEKDVQSYKTLPINEWIYESWKGFYTELTELLEDGTWGHVNQVDGGFLGFWWNWRHKITENLEFIYYLQLEQNRLRFKMAPHKRELAAENREFYRDLLFQKAIEHSINIHKNGRLGKYMTVAECSDEYRKTDKRGIIDMQATVQFLKKIGKMLDEI